MEIAQFPPKNDAARKNLLLSLYAGQEFALVNSAGHAQIATVAGPYRDSIRHGKPIALTVDQVRKGKITIGGENYYVYELNPAMRQYIAEREAQVRCRAGFTPTVEQAGAIGKIMGWI